MTRDSGQPTAPMRSDRLLPAARDARRRERTDLQLALAGGDVTVHLQPQVDLVDGRTVGVEALVRWEHPSRGVLPPRDVLPIAARAGLQRELTRTVLDLALDGAARWWSHRAPLPVSVNLAVADVTDAQLPGTVTAALVRHGLPPRALTLEVAEEALTHHGAATVLGELRALGVCVAVDDYGTGRSPLLALRRLPADELKLDPALVTDVATDARARSIAQHTVALAHALGLRVVAEGAEDDATLTALMTLGCDAVQGFAVAPAMPVDHFVTWLRRRSPDSVVRLATVPRQRTPVTAAAEETGVPALVLV